jgi:hypothetical protein
MRHALEAGTRGSAPAGLQPGPPVADLTAATSPLRSEGARRSERATARGGRSGVVSPRQPRPGPARARAAVADRPPSAPPRTRREARRSSSRRLLVALLAMLVLAVAIVAVVLITAPAPTKVTLRNVVYHDVQQASSALKQLVSENTK